MSILDSYLPHAARSVVFAQTMFPAPFHFGVDYIIQAFMCIFVGTVKRAASGGIVLCSTWQLDHHV